MLDANLRSRYDKLCIHPLLQLKAVKTAHPWAITCAGLGAGLAILPLLVFGLLYWALFCLLLSGFLDTLDGALARFQLRASPKGAVLDIISDRAVEFAVILGLFLIDPTLRALPSILMLGSILLCVTSFLVVGIFAHNPAEKSFHYSPGLIERAEAFIFFAAMILFPSAFLALSYLFSFLVLLTALIRTAQFLKT